MAEPDSDLSDDDEPVSAAAAPATLVRRCIRPRHCTLATGTQTHTMSPCSWRGRKCAASTHVS